MILGTGIDIVEPARLRLACERSRDPWPRYAGRFAAKEALLKAFGTGMGAGMGWRDIETVNDALGKPGIELNGRAREFAATKGVERIHVSISDLSGMAVASVILEGELP